MKNGDVYKDFLMLLADKLPKLPDKPEETPQTTLEALWLYSCDTSNGTQKDTMAPLPALSAKSFMRLKELIQKRVEGVPLAYLTGRQRFMNLNLLVGPDALIPRKETELLGYAALARIKEIAAIQPKVYVLDVCTGMGNLALAFAAHEPKATVSATDISHKAIELAHENARNLKLENRVFFTKADLFEPFKGSKHYGAFDVITCNPPYISTAKLEKMPPEIINYEPEEAFNGGPLGLNVILRLLKESPVYLRKGGWLCFEVGQGQGEVISRTMSRNKHFRRIEFANDSKGYIRAILAQTNI